MYYELNRLAWPLFGIAVLGTSSNPEHAVAQDAPGTFVAVTESLPDIGARAIVVRERGRDVVVLEDGEATPEALAMALLVLERARERAPRPAEGEMIPITGFVLTRDLSDERRATLEEVLARLAARPTVRVEPFGFGRWLPLDATR